MLHSVRTRTRVVVAVMALLASVLATGTAAAAPPQVQALPSPLRFVSNLDLECYKTDPYQPPVTFLIGTRHLNPSLSHLPAEATPLGPREQLCVPVAKNGVLPPPEILAFIRFVDLACYRIQGQNVNQPLRLTQLNPQLAGLPHRSVTIFYPQQLCLPVAKNGVFPPPEVRRLVSFIDLKCYLEAPQAPLNRTLNLRHLNPVLGNLPAHNATVTFNRQLCVPVQKQNQAIPPDILNIIRWIDLEKWDIVVPPPTPVIQLRLHHLNPLLVNLPVEPATLSGANQLMLPVAKNGVIPPA